MGSDSKDLYDGATEIVNALIAVFVFTEMRRKFVAYNMDAAKGFAQYLLPWTALNLIIRHVVLLKFIISYMLDGLLLILSPLTALAELVGSSVVIYIVVGMIYFMFEYVSKSDVQRSPLNNRNRLFYSTAISLLFITLRLLGFDKVVSHTETMKIVTLTIFFLLLLYVDVQRLREGLPLHLYCRALLEALLYSLVAIPVAAIAISCVFLIIVACLQKVGADPEHSDMMNALVFYGTLYCPFYILYWKAKQRLLEYPFLPIVSST